MAKKRYKFFTKTGAAKKDIFDKENRGQFFDLEALSEAMYFVREFPNLPTLFNSDAYTMVRAYSIGYTVRDTEDCYQDILYVNHSVHEVKQLLRKNLLTKRS